MWYRVLVQFAPTLSIADEMRAELLLSNAGISDVGKKIILAKPDVNRTGLVNFRAGIIRIARGACSIRTVHKGVQSDRPH